MEFEMYLHDELQEESQLCGVVLDYYEEGFEGDTEDPPYPEVFEFTVIDSSGERTLGHSDDPYNEYESVVKECRRLAIEYNDSDCDEVSMDTDIWRI